MLLMNWGDSLLTFFKRYQVQLLGLEDRQDQLRGCQKNSHNNFRVFLNKKHPNAYIISGTGGHDDAGVLQPKTFQNDLDLLLSSAVSIIPIANLDSSEMFPSRITHNP